MPKKLSPWTTAEWYHSEVTLRSALYLGGIILALQALVLFLMGQPSICECGYIKIWENIVLSAGNSQHIADWYTPSHFIHGVLFFFIFSALFPRLSFGARFLMALGVEAAWEVFENTPYVINLYREQALAQGYVGDSIINSVFDTLAMVAGFLLTRRAPVWAAVAVIIAIEIFTLYMIRDNLTLNILGFFYHFDFIAEWQSGL